MISLDDVIAARETIGGRLHRTPVFSSATLGELTGARVFLKAELFQRTGSFKPRGVLAKLATLSAEEKARGAIGISAGNHAQALAYCSAVEGLDCLVVMWKSASPQKIEATQGYGAAVDLEADDPAGAFERLAVLREETGRVFVAPFDDEVVMAGQGTVGLELVEDVPDLDVVLVPVGGGGLVAGIGVAVKARRPTARIVAVEPEDSRALQAGLWAGKSVPVEPRSIADGLSAPFAGEACLEVCRQLEVESVLVSDEEIADGMRFLYERAKLACEPAGAVGAAAVLSGRIAVEPDTSVAIVVSGGNVSARTASDILGFDEG